MRDLMPPQRNTTYQTIKNRLSGGSRRGVTFRSLLDPSHFWALTSESLLRPVCKLCTSLLKPGQIEAAQQQSANCVARQGERPVHKKSAQSI
eukprot:801481-Amphidinium_carterae.1